MTILFFDTETTGFTQPQLCVDHMLQPHTVQLAAQLCSDDGSVLGSFSFIVKPAILIPPRASEVHGITDEVAAKHGVPPEFAATAFTNLYGQADFVCAHNIKFDKLVIETLLARYGSFEKLTRPCICTMEDATPIINLPPTEKMLRAGFTKPKPPKLEECIKHFFGETLEGAHDAMVDVIACRRVYFHMKSMEASCLPT